MKRGLVLSALVVAGALSTAVGAAREGHAGQGGGQKPPSASDIQVEKVRDNLYVLRGGGGNTAAP